MDTQCREGKMGGKIRIKKVLSQDKTTSEEISLNGDGSAKPN
jgi:hypothetical protein